MGNVGAASIGTLAKDLRARLNSDDPAWRLDRDNYTVEEIASKARQYIFGEKFQALDPKPGADASFEFWVGGYSSDKSLGHEVWKIEIVNDNCAEPSIVVPPGNYGFFAGGQPGPINRLIVGFDDALVSALPGMGVRCSQKPLRKLLAFYAAKLRFR